MQINKGDDIKNLLAIYNNHKRGINHYISKYVNFRTNVRKGVNDVPEYKFPEWPVEDTLDPSHPDYEEVDNDGIIAYPYDLQEGDNIQKGKYWNTITNCIYFIAGNKQPAGLNAWKYQYFPQKGFPLINLDSNDIRDSYEISRNNFWLLHQEANKYIKKRSERFVFGEEPESLFKRNLKGLQLSVYHNRVTALIQALRIVSYQLGAGFTYTSCSMFEGSELDSCAGCDFHMRELKGYNFSRVSEPENKGLDVTITEVDSELASAYESISFDPEPTSCTDADFEGEFNFADEDSYPIYLFKDGDYQEVNSYAEYLNAKSNGWKNSFTYPSAHLEVTLEEGVTVKKNGGFSQKLMAISDPNNFDGGYTPFHIYCGGGDRLLVRIIEERNAPPSFPDSTFTDHKLCSCAQEDGQGGYKIYEDQCDETTNWTYMSCEALAAEIADADEDDTFSSAQGYDIKVDYSYLTVLDDEYAHIQ